MNFELNEANINICHSKKFIQKHSPLNPSPRA
jgi:hypothetical protein